MQHAGLTEGDSGCVASGFDALAAGFEAVDLDRRVIEEAVENADCVGAAADAGADGIGQPAGLVQDLGAGFLTDDFVEVADHRRERVCSGGGAQQVVRIAHVGHPVAQGLVDGVLERLGSVGDRDDRGPKKFHAGHVERLPAAVLGAHVDHAFQAQQGCGRGAGNTVLAGAGFGDDAGFAHSLGEQRLAQDVVDLVRAGVVEVFALEEDPHPAGVLGEALGLGQQRWPARVVLVQVGDLGRELRIGLGLLEGVLELVQGRDERLWHPPAAVVPEVGPRGVAQGRFALRGMLRGAAALQERVHGTFVRAGCWCIDHQSHHPVPLLALGIC